MIGRSKYRAVRARGATAPWRLYHSTAERDRAEELRVLEQAGAITALREQPVVELLVPLRYHADFVYEEGGRVIYEDVKGVETDRWRLVKRGWRESGPALLRVTKRAGRKRGFVVVEEIVRT